MATRLGCRLRCDPTDCEGDTNKDTACTKRAKQALQQQFTIRQNGMSSTNESERLVAFMKMVVDFILKICSSCYVVSRVDVMYDRSLLLDEN